MSRRALGWWLFAQDVCSQLHVPPTDVGAADRQFEQLLRGSVLWRFGERWSASLEAAWMESRLRRWMRAVIRERSAEPAVRLRIVARIMIVSAMTTLIVQALRPSGMDPLGWTMPAAVATAGVVTLFVAGRIALANMSDKW